MQYLNEDLDISALFTHMCDSLLKKKPDDPIEEMIRVLEQVKLNVSTQRTRNGVVSPLSLDAQLCGARAASRHSADSISSPLVWFSWMHGHRPLPRMPP